MPSSPPSLAARLWPALWLAAALASAACASAAPAPPVPGPPTLAAPATLPGPADRLPASVRPTRYALDLTLDPAAERFSGVVDVTLALAAPTADLVLHAEALELRSAVATDAAGPQPLSAVARDGVLLLRAPRPLAAGPATLRLAFDAPLGDVPIGLYRVRQGERAYAFTQFEPLEARRAFPCFDDPSLKAPFALTLRVPRGLLALSNAPELARRDGPGDLTTFTFADTPPLPTYLVALAVGPLVVRALPAAASPTPIRVVTTPEQAHLTDFAAAHAPPLLAALVAWFGSPHPFAKLDLVAVPNFAAGAMENPGLVTFREEVLLLDAADAPPERALYARVTIAHELAHLWFGDLVTPAWWDDLWLNEAFATWMASKVVGELAPELDVAVRGAAWRAHALDLDARASARAIRQPIRTPGDIYNAFDGITYTKGANLLGMIERWIGRDATQRGVRAFIEAHRYGVATTADLLAALDAASGQPVARTVLAWLDAPGSPEVEVRVQCRKGLEPLLHLRQASFRLDGMLSSAAPRPIPVCVRYPVRLSTSDAERPRAAAAREGGAGGAWAGPTEAVVGECFLFEGAEASHPLANPGCPRWLHPNDGELGFYRWRFAPEPPPVGPQAAPAVDLAALLRSGEDALRPREAAALVPALRAQLDAGTLPIERYAELLVQLGRHTDPHVLAAVHAGLAHLRRLAPEALEPRFRAFAAAVFAPHAAILDAPRLDPALAGRERERARVVLGAFAHLAELPALGAVAAEVGEAWLGALEGGGPAPPAELLELYLPLWPRVAPAAARTALWERLRLALGRATGATDRTAVVATLARFEDPALIARTLDLLRDGEVPSQDFRALSGGLGARPEAAEAVWRWLEVHLDALVARLGPHAGPGLPWLAAGFCSTADAERVRTFFEARRERIASGLDHQLAGALEVIAQCAARRARLGPAWERWLSARP